MSVTSARSPVRTVRWMAAPPSARAAVTAAIHFFFMPDHLKVSRVRTVGETANDRINTESARGLHVCALRLAGHVPGILGGARGRVRRGAGAPARAGVARRVRELHQHVAAAAVSRRSVHRLRGGAVLASVAQLAAFYVVAGVGGLGTTVGLVVVWTVFAVGGGSVFGLAGRAWRRGGLALLAGVFVLEGVLDTGWRWVAIGVVALVVSALPRPGRRASRAALRSLGRGP